jgi:hypothetical protein
MARTSLLSILILVLHVLRLTGTAWAQSSGTDNYGADHPTTAVIYDDSDYLDADSPVYVSGDAIAHGGNSKKFKMIKVLRQGMDSLKINIK